MQTLYACKMSDDPISKVKVDLLSDLKGDENIEFANHLIDYVLKNERVLDEMILEKAVNWELERMAVIDNLVLKMAIAELLDFPDVPPKVTINEAIDIVKEFCSRSSGKFVNGVLDAVHEGLRKSNRLNKTGRGLMNTNRDKKQAAPVKR